MKKRDKVNPHEKSMKEVEECVG